VDGDAIFAGLNPEQRLAVEATRGPVVIHAGAGSGKTTTITRRIAWQVASRTFAPHELLAVTFTDRAAGEMRDRLGTLGVEGVRARTIHAAALKQLHEFGRGPAAVLPSKVLILRHLANSLPKPYRFRPAADLATEIEWAKNRRLDPEGYAAVTGDRRAPLPADLMIDLYRRYERRKRERHLVDFEDLLELAIQMFEEDAHVRDLFREQCRAITVDEFQDVNLLQWTLLGLWLGASDELCVVGDDHQAIYGFTGATSRYLLDLRLRFPNARLVRLETNYRSSPQVLEVANRLTPRLGGVEKTLRTEKPDGPAPVAQSFAAREHEVGFVVERIVQLRTEGVPESEMAVLFRINSRSADWEEALRRAEIPYRVRGGGFLSRPAGRRLRAALRTSSSRAVRHEVLKRAEAEGMLPAIPEGLGEYETTRQQDLRRFVELAAELDDGERTVAGFFSELEARFGEDAVASGVHLMTLHRAKGLEFEAVFLPRLEERELPIRHARSAGEIAEERRLLYVGITRARRHLTLTWAGKPSPFLGELGLLGVQTDAPARSRFVEPDDPRYAALKRWRLERALADDLPAFVVFHNSTLAEIARRGPRSIGELAAVPGVGPMKLERYGADVLAALSRASPPAHSSAVRA
jgi:DNA helicase-2/ATP-dependent DNA helicase PcrA